MNILLFRHKKKILVFKQQKQNFSKTVHTNFGVLSTKKLILQYFSRLTFILILLGLILRKKFLIDLQQKMVSKDSMILYGIIEHK